jgi:hypothetical protein
MDRLHHQPVISKSRLRQYLGGVGLLVAALCATTLAGAATDINVGAASRGPSTATEGSIESVGVANGLVELNPSGQSVLVERGYLSTTRISVDGVNGLIKGYAGIEAGSAIAGGYAPSSGVYGLYTFAAPLSGAGTEAVPIVVELNFDAAFHATAGSPVLHLVGTVAAGGADNIYSSTLSFWQAGVGGDVLVETYAEDGNGNPYAGATPTVLSSSADSLAGIARVSFSAKPGEIIAFSIGLMGTAMAGWDGSSGWLPSTGSVDFLHTGALSILLPQGYGLDSDLPLLQNVVQVVPEPASLLLMGLGLGVLLLRRRRDAL